jgi:very-short-patch-repair endonuclease
MPRLLVPRKTPKKGRDPYRVSRSFVWIDPFPEVPGTKPEKMVYAELARRRIPFQFQEWFHVDLPLETAQWLRPDFVIPSIKMIIPVQGTYFHSKPDTIVKDSLQFAIYEMLGWTVLPLWEYDIESHLQDIFDAQPLIRSVENTGSPLPHVSRWYDDLKGLRKALSERRKPWTKKPVKIKLNHKRDTKPKIKGIFN